MSAHPGPISPDAPGNDNSPAQLDHKKPHRGHRKETIQIIYSHLPPATVLIREQHLRMQTHLAQREQELWFDRNGLADGLKDWLQTERQVVQKLSKALLNLKDGETITCI